MNFSAKHVKVGECITSDSSSYQVKQLLGSGGFGVVTLCRNNSSGRTVALKIIKQVESNVYDYGQKEALILRSLKEKGSGSYHIVQWIHSFQYREHFCHEFEKLDISLLQFQYEAPFESLRLKQIRPILTQMVGALRFLKSVGVIHCDLKPDNVMLIDHVGQPLRIKLIDFGLARAVSDTKPGETVQTVSYRAPEVVVGSSFSEPIDMWSLGCIATEMFLGKVLFWAYNSDDLIRMIVQVLGQPPKHVLDSGRRTQKYFSLPDGASDWTHMVNPEMRWLKCTVPSLDSIYSRDPYSLVGQSSEAENVDRAVFIDLLKRMLDLDPQTRISPERALDHPFLTLTHLGQKYHEYTLASKTIQLQALDICREEQSSTSSKSSSSRHTPEAAQEQTSGLKRKREEEESTRKRTSTSSKSSSSRHTPEAAQEQTSGLKRKRQEEKCTWKQTSTSSTSLQTPQITQEQTSGLKRKREEEESTRKRTSTSSKSSSFLQTPEVAQGKTSGLKRKREEEVSPQKRARKDTSVSVVSSVQGSGEVHKKSKTDEQEVIILNSSSANSSKKQSLGAFSEESPDVILLESISENRERKREEEEVMDLDVEFVREIRKGRNREKKKYGPSQNEQEKATRGSH